MSNLPPEPHQPGQPGNPGNYPGYSGQPEASNPQTGYGSPTGTSTPLPDDLSQGWLPEDTRQRPASPFPAPKLWGFQTLLPFKMTNALRHPGEIPWLITAYFVTLVAYIGVGLYLGYLLFSDSSDFVFLSSLDDLFFQLLFLVVYLPLGIFFARAVMYAQLRLMGVRITPTQFPEAYQMLVEAARAAGLRRVPDAYVQLGNGQINAFASGHGHRRFIAIYSDLFEIGGAPRNPEALRFIIGHEVGHIAAGHTSYFRLIFTSLFMRIPFVGSTLSRAQEYTADNFGYRFSPEGAPTVMGVLGAGKYLCNEVNFDELSNRAVYERGFFTWFANLSLSHPPTTWRAHALRDRSEPGRLIWRPKNNPPYPLSMVPAAEPAEQWADPLQALDFYALHPEDPKNQHWGTVQTVKKETATLRDRKITDDYLFTGWVPPHLRQQNQWGVPSGGWQPPAQPAAPYQPTQPPQENRFGSYNPETNRPEYGAEN